MQTRDKKENELSGRLSLSQNSTQSALSLSEIAAYIPRTDKIDDIINHEIGHFVYGDPSFQNEFKAFWDSIPDNAKGQINDIINSLYNEKTNQIQIEERQVQAFASLIKSNREERTHGRSVRGPDQEACSTQEPLIASWRSPRWSNGHSLCYAAAILRGSQAVSRSSETMD
jgi:hypothetical protein